MRESVSSEPGDFTEERICCPLGAIPCRSIQSARPGSQISTLECLKSRLQCSQCL